MLYGLYFTGETAAIANTEVDASKLASSSGAEAEAVRQVSPESNTSTVVNLAEKGRQRNMLRHGGGGAPTALSPQNTRPWESSTWSNSQSAGKKIWRGNKDRSESAQNHIALG
ncbi:hypothetical protein POTOM_036498 [Populus tomentosa]|uniref:Uncharacterized protein n=1 Tax=Populus tomentosa TaxID=118781 RepID=A0A8X8CN27_POPTO|nr:hypothetical protein POTOM_036498 [Populus tomentosa]